jgi:hypothetical protein
MFSGLTEFGYTTEISQIEISMSISTDALKSDAGTKV